jgi:hypothetical protein
VWSSPLAYRIHIRRRPVREMGVEKHTVSAIERIIEELLKKSSKSKTSPRTARLCKVGQRISNKGVPFKGKLRTFIENQLSHRFSVTKSVITERQVRIASATSKKKTADRKKKEQQVPSSSGETKRSAAHPLLLHNLQLHPKTAAPQLPDRAATAATATAAATAATRATDPVFDNLHFQPREVTISPATKQSLFAALSRPSRDQKSSGQDQSSTRVANVSYREGFAPEWAWFADRAKVSLSSKLFGNSEEKQKKLYLNVHDPFCLTTCGVQGAGKSHTVGVVVESCVLPFTMVNKLNSPMACLILHRADRDADANALVMVDTLQARIAELAASQPSEIHFQLPQVIVYVSPSRLRQQRELYTNHQVLPLLFDWGALTANQIKQLMGLEETGGQLYVARMFSELQKYSRDGAIPEYEQFKQNMKELCGIGMQNAALEQRFAVLDTFIANSEQNAGESLVDFTKCVQPGVVILADLTDPFLNDVAGVFDVMLGQFRKVASTCGKVLVCDEAHHYLTPNVTSGLTANLLSCVRMMRHENIRVVVSTQNPCSLPKELFELHTMSVFHRFHSPAWCVSSKQCVVSIV